MDLIIHNNSCHPYEHKKSAINYLHNCMNTYSITHENINNELQMIKMILLNNQYQPEVIYEKHKYNPDNKNSQLTQNIQWATFTYFGTETRAITNTNKNHLKTSN
jgi:hypothetical protein